MPTLHSTQFLPVVALTAAAMAQVGWTQRNPATRPGPRDVHSIVYDSTRGVSVLFGGWGVSGQFGDTWEWNGVNWTQRVTTVSPPARGASALSFDIGRARVVLFGGTPLPAPVLNDTWEYDGNNWTQMQPATSPSPRRFTRMEYDVARGRSVLFGGESGQGGVVFDETWEWNGVNWLQRNPATTPGPRWGHVMTYDFLHSEVVLSGGNAAAAQVLNDTWTWDGSNWSQIAGPAATGTYGATLAYDATHGIAVRFGGVITWTETWLFDHVAWRLDPRTVTPPARVYAALVHDIARGRTVLFGGFYTGTYRNDTWEYDPGTIARWTPFGSGCSGTSGVPTLRPVGATLPIVSSSFVLELQNVPGSGAVISYGFSNQQWNGNTLPFGLGALGMTGCTLHASPDIVFFTPATAGRATLSWSLPNDPSLIGVTFFNQGFVLDPGINPLGATVSNAGAGIIGPF